MTKDQELYYEIIELVKNTYNYDEQLIIIARWIASEFERKSLTTK